MRERPNRLIALMQGREIYLSVEEQSAGDCEEEPEDEDEFEDEEPDLCVKE